MSNLISFVLFGDHERYWASLPSVILSNRILYPDFVLKFFVHIGTTTHPCFLFLQELAKADDHIQLEIIHSDYIGTELTLWRLKPLWDDTTSILLCRDLDAAIRLLEYKAVRYFVDSPHCAHSIRSYACHTVPFLAGLCGFKARETRSHISSVLPTFESCIQKTKALYPTGEWGCDQFILRDLFSLALNKNILDCPQETAPISLPQYNPTRVDTSAYAPLALTALQATVLTCTDSWSGFAGNACIIRADKFSVLLASVIDHPSAQLIHSIFANSKKLSDVFGVVVS